MRARRVAWRLALALVSAAPAALVACGPAPLPELPERASILLVTVDTLRPDRLSCYGYERHRTPGICRLAEEGVLFEDARSDTPWTTPSMASVLTGLYPTLHGFKSNNAHRLGAEQETLAEVLAARGYATAAVIGSFPLDSIYGLDQGFERYDDAFTTPIWTFPDHEPGRLPSEFGETPEARREFTLAKAVNDSRRTDAEVTDAALAWLREHDARPFFLWVHYFGPHTKPDWRVPEAQRERLHRERYDPDVLENDREVGRLLAHLDEAGLSDGTLVIFHADHGESLGEQGYLGHGQLLNEATLHIPLLLRLPGVLPAGRRVTETVQNVDIFPTALAVSGGPDGRERSGVSLFEVLRAPGGAPRPAYAESFYPAHEAFAWKERLPDGSELPVGLARRGVRRGRFKLVRQQPTPLLDVSAAEQAPVPARLRERLRGEALYDLDAPGGDSTDVLARHPEVAAELRVLLDAQLARERGAAQPLAVDEETRLRLESLGYGE